MRIIDDPVHLGCANGDVLLRIGVEAWIADLTGGKFTHAGICSQASTRTATHAHPRPTGSAVYDIPIADFFSENEAPGGGGIYTPNVLDDGELAAYWTREQRGRVYEFTLQDPILGQLGEPVQNNNRLYCSAFVWWAYREGAGVELVLAADFVNLLAPALRDRTLHALLNAAREHHPVYRLLPDNVVLEKIEWNLRTHNGFFVTPHQLSESPLLHESYRLEWPLATTSASGGKKS